MVKEKEDVSPFKPLSKAEIIFWAEQLAKADAVDNMFVQPTGKAKEESKGKPTKVEDKS